MSYVLTHRYRDFLTLSFYQYVSIGNVSYTISAVRVRSFVIHNIIGYFHTLSFSSSDKLFESTTDSELLAMRTMSNSSTPILRMTAHANGNENTTVNGYDVNCLASR